MIFVLLLLAVIVVSAGFYTLDETEQAVVTQFGKPVGEAVKEPGLHWKVPFIQKVRRYEKRILAWDGDPDQIPIKGNEFISIDTTARWRIANPLKFLQSVNNESGAQSRLDDIIDSAVRDKASNIDIVEIVRSHDWNISDEDLKDTRIGEAEKAILMKKVEMGRQQLENEILAQSQKSMPDYGIELLDVRIQRINYIEEVEREVFNRMISENQRIAEKYRSEGLGRSAEIMGNLEKEKKEIQSSAERDADIIRGKAEAEATRIYNEAYGMDPEFFAFYRTLESYRESIGKGTTLIIGLDSDYFRYLKKVMPEGTAERTDGGN